MVRKMLHVWYFDWNGTDEELKAYCKKLKSVCENNDIAYKGCYGPPQDRYHYAIFMENTKNVAQSADYNAFNPVFRDSDGKPSQMGHVIMKYYVNRGM